VNIDPNLTRIIMLSEFTHSFTAMSDDLNSWMSDLQPKQASMMG